MKKTTAFIKIGSIVLDVIQLYIPLITFVIMFTAFVTQIFFRYVVNHPLIWPFEVTILTFIWTTMLGACYIRKIHKHVNFDMVYVNRTKKGKMIFRIIGNALVTFACGVAFWPSCIYIRDIHIEKTPVLRVPFSIAFFPLLVFIVLMFGYSLHDIVLDLIRYKRGEF